MPRMKSVSDIIKWHFEYQKNKKDIDESCVYRGQAKNMKLWPLIPKIARKQTDSSDVTSLSKEEIAKKELELFKYLSTYLPGFQFEFEEVEGDNSHKWKYLFIAQHYGIQTRLLDFTRNPLFACFNAAINEPESDGIIIRIRYNQQLHLYVYDEKELIEKQIVSERQEKVNRIRQLDPFNLDESIFVVPPHLDPIIRAQDSVFLCFKDPEVELTKRSKFLKKSGLDVCFEIITIPAKYKEEIQKELNWIGMNHSKMYPNLGGISQFIDWRINRIIRDRE